MAEAPTTIVNVSVEQLDKFIAYLNEATGDSIESLSDIKVFTAFMVKHTNALLNNLEDDDAEGCFQMLFKELQQESDPALVSQLVKELTSAISSDTENKVVLRLKILANMYNVLSSIGASVFIVVLLSIIKYAGAIGQMDLLHGYFNSLDALVVKWKLSATESRDLFLQVSLALEAQGSEEKAQLFLIKALSSSDDSTKADDEEKKLAAKCMVGAVRRPIVCFMDRHDILNLRGVAALKNDPTHGQLYNLLSIFSSNKLKEYNQFINQDNGKQLLKKHDLDHHLIVDNMRLLTMCSLATEHTEIPYEIIATELDIPIDEVEAWVVKTISAKLIDAKMDQFTQRVMISRCTHRIFGQAQWNELQLKLNSWKSNLRGILDTLAKTEALKTNASPSTNN